MRREGRGICSYEQRYYKQRSCILLAPRGATKGSYIPCYDDDIVLGYK
jgi:hypothetical protein